MAADGPKNCHRDRSVAQWKDLRFLLQFLPRPNALPQWLSIAHQQPFLARPVCPGYKADPAFKRTPLVAIDSIVNRGQRALVDLDGARSHGVGCELSSPE